MFARSKKQDERISRGRSTSRNTSPKSNRRRINKQRHYKTTKNVKGGLKQKKKQPAKDYQLELDSTKQQDTDEETDVVPDDDKPQSVMFKEKIKKSRELVEEPIEEAFEEPDDETAFVEKRTSGSLLKRILKRLSDGFSVKKKSGKQDRSSDDMDLSNTGEAKRDSLESIKSSLEYIKSYGSVANMSDNAAKSGKQKSGASIPSKLYGRGQHGVNEKASTAKREWENQTNTNQVNNNSCRLGLASNSVQLNDSSERNANKNSKISKKSTSWMSWKNQSHTKKRNENLFAKNICYTHLPQDDLEMSNDFSESDDGSLST